MSKGDEMKMSSDTAISMPMRNLLSILAAVGVGVWAYFGVIERLNNLETKSTLAEKDLTSEVSRIDKDIESLITGDIALNNEFRIKWPRGDLGSLPADAEQFMLIEHLTGEFDKILSNIETGKAPFDQQQALTLDFYKQRIETLEGKVETLKDNVANLKAHNGN